MRRYVRIKNVILMSVLSLFSAFVSMMLFTQLKQFTHVPYGNHQIFNSLYWIFLGCSFISNAALFLSGILLIIFDCKGDFEENASDSVKQRIDKERVRIDIVEEIETMNR